MVRAAVRHAQFCRPRRILFGQEHFTSSVGGFAVVDSVCVLDAEIDSLHFRITRLLLLFPGTTIELGSLVKDDEAAPETKEDENVGQNDPADNPPADKPDEKSAGDVPDDESKAPVEDEVDSDEPDTEEVAKAHEDVKAEIEGVAVDSESAAVDAEPEAPKVEGKGALENSADVDELAKAAAADEAAKVADDESKEDAKPADETAVVPAPKKSKGRKSSKKKGAKA